MSKRQTNNGHRDADPYREEWEAELKRLEAEEPRPDGLMVQAERESL